MRGEKKLLKRLKIKYFQLILMKYLKNRKDLKKNCKISEMKMVSLITKGLHN